MPIRPLFVFALTLLLWSCSVPAGVYHTVRPGQTLYRISKAYGVNERYLARINGVNDPTQLKAGTRLFIPGATHPQRVPATVEGAGDQAASARAPAPPPPRISPQPRVASHPVEVRRRAPSPGTAPTPSASGPAPSAKPAKVTFVWPVHGAILRKFGAVGSEPSKGVDIATRPGTPVEAAAAGKVIYSGNGIRGFGNLVIVKHDQDFYTVYAYNERNLVTAGSFVSRGQKIALAGYPPGGGRSRLHFEIRHGKQPVNPIFYLP